MKIKRWIGMILTCALIFAMTGCGAGNQTQPDDAGTSDDTAQVSASADDETLKEAQAEEHSDTQTSNAGDNTTGGGNILVVYFSYTGHLDSMANWIADETGGDLIRVSAKDAYPEDYDDTVDRAKKEQDEDSRPEIDVDLTEEQIAGYDTVFFGLPVWWYDIPMPMYTFLDSYDFTGKTIIPFLSHEGSSNGGSAEQTINEHARGAAVRFEDALSIRGGKVDSSEQDVRDWVDGLGFGK